MNPALAASILAATITLLAAMPEVRANAAPAAVSAELSEARLAGEGDLRWFGLRIYSAQLWVGRPGLRIDRPSATPFALELRYATALKGTLIAERSVQEMERMGFGDAQRRGRWLDAMKRLFPDVAKGDRLTGLNEPGRGTRFFYNDRAIGSVDDADFSNAFFAIWLDERTVAPALRESLMRNAADTSGATR
jgi:hypothetical protein